jgi:hypothetical protein
MASALAKPGAWKGGDTVSNQHRPNDGFIGRPHWSDHGDGPFLHQDQWRNGERIDHIPVDDPLGAFAIGGALEDARRQEKPPQ